MRIVGSIATIPSRINYLEDTLASIHRQTRRLDSLYVIIPAYCKKEQSGYVVPDFIKNYAQVVVLTDDYGPLNKLIGPLQEEKDPKTRIITFDDDIVYPANLIEYLQQKSEERPNAAIGTAGIKIGTFPSYLSFSTNYDNASRWWFNFIPKNHGEEVDILVGYAGNMYRRDFFPSELDELTRHALEDSDIFKNDDVLIASWLSKVGVDRCVYPGPEIQRRDISYYGGLSNDMLNFAKRAHSAVKSCERRGLLQQRVPVKWCWTMTGPIVLLMLLVFIVICAIKL